MVKNLYLILVVVSRVVGLYLCINACTVIVAGSFIWSSGNRQFQSSLTLSLILSFIIGGVLLFLAKPIARALTSELE